VTTASTTSRSDLLRGRIRALDELEARAVAASAGPADPESAARRAALGRRIDGARRLAAEELARHDRMERLRREAAAIRRDGLLQRQRIAEADARLEASRRELFREEPRRPLELRDLSPGEQARYREARAARDEARRRLGEDREALARKEAEYRVEEAKALEREKAEGRKEGDVADPCVSLGASEAGKRGHEAGRADGRAAVGPRGEVRR